MRSDTARPIGGHAVKDGESAGQSAHTAAYAASWTNRDEIEASTSCACFHCGVRFGPAEVTEWVVDPDGDNRSAPALRRGCGYRRCLRMVVGRRAARLQAASLVRLGKRRLVHSAAIGPVPGARGLRFRQRSATAPFSPSSASASPTGPAGAKTIDRRFPRPSQSTGRPAAGVGRTGVPIWRLSP